MRIPGEYIEKIMLVYPMNIKFAFAFLSLVPSLGNLGYYYLKARISFKIFKLITKMNLEMVSALDIST
jgi:hypothetical protein